MGELTTSRPLTTLAEKFDTLSVLREFVKLARRCQQRSLLVGQALLFRSCAVNGRTPA
ncbi:hypothetical protein U1737_06835 [Sphingomonas sp. LB3N6]|uniref:hypothetical protein n=1 Tax=Sphingomonas fucosidasi TaxID=3096164 RepID=UPI002FC7BC69